MRFLHISDLHIGRRLYERSLIDDQRKVLFELTALARECDAVLISGDIYDRYAPSAEATRLASDFFVELSRTGKPVFAVSGNHDSAEQVAYCREVMAAGGIFVSPAFDGRLCTHTLRDEHGEIDIVLMPFLKPAIMRPYCADIADCDSAVRFALSTVPQCAGRRRVLVAHQYVTGASVCDSEALSLGGLNQVSAAAFDGFDYVALGHLHSPQGLCEGRVRYCGSPLKYSLSEARQHKCATIATLGAKGELSVETRDIIPEHELRVARGELRALYAPENYSEDYVYASLTDTCALLDPIGALRVCYPNLLGMRIEASEYSDEETLTDAVAAESRSPLEHFIDFYTAQHGGRAPDSERVRLMRELIENAEARAI